MKKSKMFLMFALCWAISFNILNAQSAKRTEDFPGMQTGEAVQSFPNHLQAQGKILGTIQLIDTRDPLGVTVVNSKLIVTSSDGKGNNYFDVYDFNGNLISSTAQGTTTNWGYRGLAFDGTYILASDDSTIKKIDPNTFNVVSFIKNNSHSPHRGIAYVPGENAIYSTNFSNGYLVKIDATTGATIKTLKKPYSSPYGIAFDHYSYSNGGYLWFAEPCLYGKFRLSRVDTIDGNCDYTYDFSSQLPDSALNGGIEIIDNHPDYPGKIVAVMVEQDYRKIIFADITDTPLTFPLDVEYKGEFGGFDETGLDINFWDVFNDYLYVVNNDREIAIFNIKDNPIVPTKIASFSPGDGIDNFFLKDSLLFVPHATVVPDTIAIYKMQNPLSWEYKSSFVVDGYVLNIKFYGHYAFVIMQNISKVQIFDISDLNNITLQKSIEVPPTNKIYSLELNQNRGLLLLGIKDSLKIYNVRNPINPVLISSKHIGEIPYKMDIIDDNYFAYIGSGEAGGIWFLECWDYSDSSNIANVDGWGIRALVDLKVANGLILVTSGGFPFKGLNLFSLDTEMGKLRQGPHLEFDDAQLIAVYTPSSSSSPIVRRFNSINSNSSNGNYTKQWDSKETYYYTSRGESYWPYSYGSEKAKIFRTKPPASTVSLTMGVYPPDAERDGCGTDPSVGIHHYARGSSQKIRPIEKPHKGWYFTKWTGSINTTTKEPTIIMDRNKNVIANFGKLMLTVSGTIPDTGFCPMAIRKIPRFLNLPINICASDGDGWNLSSISFKATGSGNEKEDIDGVFLYKGSTLLFYGKFDQDNGTLKAVFNPPLQIPAGECINLILSYQFDFNPVTYAQNGIIGFHVETAAVSATPMNHSSGIIQGKAQKGKNLQVLQ
jgi:hypothetical protein